MCSSRVFLYVFNLLLLSQLLALHHVARQLGNSWSKRRWGRESTRSSTRIKSVQLEDRRFRPLLAGLLSVSSLITAPLVQNVQGSDSLVDGDLGGIEGSKQVLLALQLGFRVQKLTARQAGLHVGNAALVSREVRLVPLFELLGLWEQLVKFGIDNLGNLLGKRLCKALKRLAEAKQLKVEGRVGGIDRIGSHKTLDGKDVLVYNNISMRAPSNSLPN